MKLIAKAVVTIMTALCFTAAVYAATFTVDSFNDTPDQVDGDGACSDAIHQCSFRAAIDEANALPGDDTIILPAGTFTQTAAASNEDNNLDGDWDIRSNITITGAGAGMTFLQANALPNTATERVLHSVLATNIVTITGVTIRNGVRSGFVTNDNSRGGGIYNNGTLTLNNSIVTSNRTNGGGAGIMNFGNITLNNASVSDNRCEAVANECYGGGMLSFLKTTKNITIVGSTFDHNYVKAVQDSLGYGNAGGMGVQTTDGTGVNLLISGSKFTNNTGEGFGTDINLGGGKGGGVYLSTKGPSVVNITGTEFRANRVIQGYNEFGGGIYVESRGGFTGLWDRLTVADNTAAFGNGIYLSAQASGLTAVDIKYSTISNNMPNFAGGAGGGISVIGQDSSNLTVNFLNTTISGNRNSNGGGAYIVEAASNNHVTANFNFCTVVNNQVESSLNSAGISTFLGPTSSANLKNTIVANTTIISSGNPAPDIVNKVASQDYNLVENDNSSTFMPAAHDTIGADPQLGPLADNGGPTLTHRPANNSPAVNAIPLGQNGCGDVENRFDQRLFARPNDGTSCDKGAVELNSGPYDVSGTVRTAGGMPIRNAVVVLQGGSLSQPVYYLTNNFGLYLFPDLAPGQYTVSISSKRYTFDPQPLNLQRDELAIDFTAQPESRMNIEFPTSPKTVLAKRARIR